MSRVLIKAPADSISTWFLRMDSKVSLSLIKNWKALCNDIVFTDIAPVLLQNLIITVNEYQYITSLPETSRIETLLLVLLKSDESVVLKFGDCLEKDYSWLAKQLKEECITKMEEEGRDETDAIPVTPITSHTHFENETTEDEKEMCVDCNKLHSIDTKPLNNKVNLKSKKLERRKITKSRVKNKLKSKLQNSETVISSSTDFIKPVLNEEVTNEVITVVKNCSLASKSWTTIAHSLGLTDRVHDIRFKVVLHGEDLNMCIVYLIKTWLEMFPREATLSKLIEVLRSENFNRVADQLTEMLYRKPVTADGKI